MSVLTVLSPLLIINYVFGLKIVQLPIGYPRPWFGLLYILILWLIYYFLRVYISIMYIDHYNFTIYIILNGLWDFTTLLSIMSGMYHNKKFRNSLKKLALVDATLEKLGIITNYQQLRKQIIRIIIGWFVIAILLNNVQIIFMQKLFNCDTMTAICFSYIWNYCAHINFLADLTMTSIIRYIGIKFDQINKHIIIMANNNKYGMTQTWNTIMLHMLQRRLAKTPNNKWIIWIIIQLHLELRKISRELDLIYGVEITFKMGTYFIFMTTTLNGIFHVIFIPNYTNNIVLYAIIVIFWCFHNILKLLVINFVCEKVSNQANSTKSSLNKILNSINDIETCENISQLLLHIKLSPLRFGGIGLFQFGYKFIYEFVSSVGTVLIILTQAHTTSENVLKNL